jgi:hypothetical protein
MANGRAMSTEPAGAARAIEAAAGGQYHPPQETKRSRNAVEAQRVVREGIQKRDNVLGRGNGLGGPGGHPPWGRSFDQGAPKTKTPIRPTSWDHAADELVRDGARVAAELDLSLEAVLADLLLRQSLRRLRDATLELRKAGAELSDRRRHDEKTRRELAHARESYPPDWVPRYIARVADAGARHERAHRRAMRARTEVECAYAALTADLRELGPIIAEARDERACRRDAERVREAGLR